VRSADLARTHRERLVFVRGDDSKARAPQKLKIPHESKPWNPLIVNAFYRAGVIERWGSGTPEVTPQVTPQFTPQFTPQIEQLLNVLEGKMTREELMQKAKYYPRSYCWDSDC